MENKTLFSVMGNFTKFLAPSFIHVFPNEAFNNSLRAKRIVL